jgi:hypothetical protein
LAQAVVAARLLSVQMLRATTVVTAVPGLRRQFLVRL